MRGQLFSAIEEASQGAACASCWTCRTERLFGPPRALAERLRNALKAAGFRASVAVSANFIRRAYWRSIARHHRNPGRREAQLSQPSIALLEIPQNHAETLAIWGIRTLASCGAAEVDLIARLGQSASTWRNSRSARKRSLSTDRGAFRSAVLRV